MTKMVDVDVAQTTLNELIDGLKPDEQVVLMRDQQPVAILLPSPRRHKPRKAGNCKGMIKVLADDDEHLEDFAEYMP
jgi:antitoxin (DNA-binding transcriptional repressor) of toxin-antitoxin stability system